MSTKRKPHSAESRARMSVAIKRALADPEVRARRSEAIKRALADPEVRARRSEAAKKQGAKFEIPKWVPQDLREEFSKVARKSGEEAGASHIRRLKREMAMS